MTKPVNPYTLEVNNDDGTCYDICICKQGKPIATVMTSDNEIMPLLRAGNLMPALLDALYDIKRLAGKSGDHEADPFALLDLIADMALTAIHQVNQR
jgi:hypothetical protein